MSSTNCAASARRHAGAAVAADGERTGVEVSYDIADLSRTDDRARLVESIRARYGAVHALVNNAGRAPRMRADILEATEESFEEVMRTNLQGPYFLTQQIAGLMVEQKKASPDSAGVDRLRHLGIRRHGLAEPRRILRQQGRPGDDREALRAAPRGICDPRL